MLEELQEEKEALMNYLHDLQGKVNKVKDKLAKKKTPELESRRRKLGFEYQKLMRKLASNKDKMKQIKMKQDAKDKRRANQFANHLLKQHIQWETFFVESAREYLSGHEFEVIANRATSKQNIRNL